MPLKKKKVAGGHTQKIKIYRFDGMYSKKKILFSFFIFLILFLNKNIYAHSNFDENNLEDLDKVIEIWIQENPDKIRSALEKLAQKEEARKNKETFDLLTNNFLDPSIGNPSGDIVIYEFFDYNCGYCKSVFDTILKVINSDKNVRFVFKELPILSQSSIDAAYFALASQKQNLYREFHTNVMQYRGRINKDVLLNIAKKIGLNIDKLNEDLKSDDIKFIIQKNKELAQRLNINGTPSFVIGEKVYPGALNEDQFVKLIKEERKNTY